MNIQEKYHDHIGFYNNILPDGFCPYFIKEFDKLESEGLCSNRQDSEHIQKIKKEDSNFFLNYYNHRGSIKLFNDTSCYKVISNAIQNCFDLYTDKFDILKSIPLSSTTIKIQKTIPGAGYHLWHCEQSNGDAAARVLSFIIYLNDIKDAGETEFLYQKVRVPAQENTAVFFPAAYTHAHRGNVVHGDKAKYIITGWFHIN